MEDVTSLVLKVESGQVTLAHKELDKLSGSSVRAEKTTDKVTGAFKRLLGPLLATVSAYKGLQKLISTTREFDILNAQLITATGSAEGAATAFGAIQDFATNTPFQLQEVTEAFVQLVNRGLDPSEESLTNIGNFASAFGRNILDATRAIGQATTGEFESLKQFGIVARKEGDRVKFTFRGITTEVAFNAREIQGYMNELAANNFAGAMEERMNTLDGALSNLADSWDKFWLTASQSGAGMLAEEIVRTLIDAVEGLEDALDDNVAGQFLQALAISLKAIKAEADRNIFDDLAGDITKVGIAQQRFGEMQFRTDKIEDYIRDYKDVVAQLGEGEFQTAIDNINQNIREQERVVESALSKLAKDPGSTGLSVRAEEATKKLQVLRFMLEGVVGEMQNFNPIGTVDRLQGFGVGADGDQGPTSEELKAQDAFEKLRESLLTEEEAIQESYEKRKQIILDSTLTTEEEKARIMDRLEKAHAEEIRQFEIQRWNTALSSFDDFQNNLLVLARTGSNELAGIYKAAAIANTIIKTYESATAAYAAMAGIPVVGPALGAAAAAAAVAAGLANVQAIASQQVGNYATGGVVPGNNFNGDNLNAGVNSGEMILNFSQQKQLLDMANGKGGGSKPVVVNVQNFGNSDVEVSEEDAGEERIINIAVGRAKRETKQEIASEFRTGNGDVARSAESSYNLKRGAG